MGKGIDTRVIMAFDGDMRSGCVMRWWWSAAVAIALAAPVRADTIRLRNGNAIEGIITQENDRQVVLELGTGSTSVSRGTIAAVERASEDENNRLRSGWKQKYFLHQQYMPEELKPLAAEFAKLSALRGEALRVRQMHVAFSAQEAGAKTEQEQIRAQGAQVRQQLQQVAAPNRSNMAAYNALVASNNALQVRTAQLTEALTAGQQECDAAAGRIAVYQDALSAFVRQFDEERRKTATAAGSEDRKQFFDRLAVTLAEYARDFTSAEVAVTQSRNETIVVVTVNDRLSGRFILDTGAARVSVSEEFARRLQLDLAALPEAEFIMADGRKIKGRTVVFRSLAVGDARAENIEAGIISGKPGEQIDGLLGMSFLKHFSVNLDGGSGKLILRPFAPKL